MMKRDNVSIPRTLYVSVANSNYFSNFIYIF